MKTCSVFRLFARNGKVWRSPFRQTNLKNNKLLVPAAAIAGLTIGLGVSAALVIAIADLFQPIPPETSLLSEQGTPTASSPLKGFCHPTDEMGKFSQESDGPTHKGRTRYAKDISIAEGHPVYAMRAGTVVNFRDHFHDTGGDRRYAAKYNYVILEHDSGYYSAYLHLQHQFNRVINLRHSQKVERGQLIGFTGNSGWSNGPHIHVEIQKAGQGEILNSKRLKNTIPFAIRAKCKG